MLGGVQSAEPKELKLDQSSIPDLLTGRIDVILKLPFLNNECRKPEYNVDQIFLDRWSPRAMLGKETSKDELMSLFEAAKWAPSSYNNQPWRFLYAMRNTENWKLFFNLMVEGNKAWTKNAAALIVVISKKTFDNGKPSRTHSFDAGAA